MTKPSSIQLRHDCPTCSDQYPPGHIGDGHSCRFTFCNGKEVLQFRYDEASDTYTIYKKVHPKNRNEGEEWTMIEVLQFPMKMRVV